MDLALTFLVWLGVGVLAALALPVVLLSLMFTLLIIGLLLDW